MEIKNARITKAELSMADHGCLTMWLTLEGSGWGCGFGGYCLGKGYLGAKEFEGSAKGMESIMRIMDVVGVDRFTALKDKYVRAELEGWSYFFEPEVLAWMPLPEPYKQEDEHGS